MSSSTTTSSGCQPDDEHSPDSRRHFWALKLKPEPKQLLFRAQQRRARRQRTGAHARRFGTALLGLEVKLLCKSFLCTFLSSLSLLCTHTHTNLNQSATTVALSLTLSPLPRKTKQNTPTLKKDRRQDQGPAKAARHGRRCLQGVMRVFVLLLSVVWWWRPSSLVL